jgi:flagellar protein FliJ
MANFRFRLETLLKVRRDQRDVQRQQYAKALEAQKILADQITQIDQDIKDTHSIMRTNAAPGAIDVDRLLRIHRYELLLQAQRQQLEQQAERVAQEVERRRQALIHADREVRLLEKLREKQLEAFQREHDRREQKLLDEIAQHTHNATRLGADTGW